MNKENLRIDKVSYDYFKNYDQDAINGLDEDFLNNFADLCGLKDGEIVLELMSGDGKFASRLLAKNANIKLTLSDISKAQCETAQNRLGEKVNIFTQDLLEDDLSIFQERFDVVIIKSGNHEIPEDKQKKLYSIVYNCLKPGGRFINLGILLENKQFQNEINILNKYRSELANITQDIKNRNFALRSDFYQNLFDSNFSQVYPLKIFNYQIDMGILAKEYFQNDEEKRIIMNGVATTLTTLRKNNLTILKDNWIVCLPGEITLAQKPQYFN